jgi:integrase
VKHKLNATLVKNTLPREKEFKLSDGAGLYLLVKTNGTKCWRYNYRFDGRSKTLAIGIYPAITLAEARARHDIAHQQLADGLDPSLVKREQRLARILANGDTFELVARDWFNVRIADQSISHQKRTMGLLERHLFPVLGRHPISRISTPELLHAIRRIESRGTLDMAHRSKAVAGQIFRFAIATGRAERDPSRDLEGALKPKRVKHHAAILDPTALGQLLRDIDAFQGDPSVAIALRISPHLFQRPGEIRTMAWEEIDWSSSAWMLPAEKMKMRRPHMVPLSGQVQALLKLQLKLTGNKLWVFPSPSKRSRPISDNAVRSALRRMGYGNDQITPHGFRAIARTLLDEVLGFRADLIEHQLAHAVRDPTGRAYNRTSHLEARAAMMQTWSDYLDELKQGKYSGSGIGRQK